MLQWNQDRTVVLLMTDVWTRRHLERRIVGQVMWWWLQRHDRRIALAALHHCWYCGHVPTTIEPRLCLDHVFPSHYVTTPLVPCCLPCNRVKGVRTPNEMRPWRRFGGYWFERGIFVQSPLGYVLLEDFTGFRGLLAHFLMEASS
jgi:hypothetical protein